MNVCMAFTRSPNMGEEETRNVMELPSLWGSSFPEVILLLTASHERWVSMGVRDSGDRV